MSSETLGSIFICGSHRNRRWGGCCADAGGRLDQESSGDQQRARGEWVSLIALEPHAAEVPSAKQLDVEAALSPDPRMHHVHVLEAD